MLLRRPKILFLTPTWPIDQAFGGQMRALHIGRALQQLGHVTLVVVGSDADRFDAQQRTAAEFDVRRPVPEYLAGRHGPAHRFRWALDSRYLNLHGVVASPIDRARIASYIPEHDLVWIMNSRTANIVQLWHWPHTHLDVDDVPSTYASGIGSATLLQQLKSRTRRALLHRREHDFRRRFTTLSVCSERDRRYLGGNRIHVIPNGFVRPSAPPQRNVALDAPRLGFIGLYSHPPNLDSMRWFLREIWPRILRAVPEARLRLVGQETDGALKPSDPNVDALGWLADPTDEIATWSATVVPIRFGGGTRIKIAEAFSRKCPVVATRFGAYGYEVANARELRLADEPAAFADACIGFIRDPLEGAATAERAWTAFLENWTWDSIAPKVLAAADDCLRRSRARAALS